MQITIGGEDVTPVVVWTSIKIENILTQQVDRCSFTIQNPVPLESRASLGYYYKPNQGREVVILDDDGNRVFGGVIVRRTDKSNVHGQLNYEVECSDYTRLLDQKLIAETYENMTVNDIIDDIIANWSPAGFTATQVDCPLTISYIQFKYEPVSSCIKQLADVVGYDWYIDYYRDIYFKSPVAEDAPFDITDTDGTHTEGSLIIRRDNSQLRNSIIVRGGEYLGSEFTASVRADGKQSTFNLPYKFTDFKATLTGHPLTIGIDYLEDPDDFDAMYNFQEKLLKFKEEDKPNQNATLSFGGKPHLPVIVKYRDALSTASIFSAEGIGDGRYEYVIIDKSINSQVGARERAAAEIRTYGETLSEGEFETDIVGLKAGQRLHINSAVRGLDEYFVINRVTTVMRTTTSFYYKVSLITTKTMDYIALLKKLILRDNKALDIRSSEQLDLIESALETITISDILLTSTTGDVVTGETITMNETFTAQSLNYGVQWVLGPQVPTTTKRVFILNGSKLK
jgi:hypothetical protein